MKRLILAVTNDLSYDQRMQRICRTLAENNYDVTLVGRKLSHSRPLRKEPYTQKRLRCLSNKGPLFYAEYNVRLFLFLLFRRFDGVCAIDIDTALACFTAGRIKGALRFYDAHELFTEMKEVRSRPPVHKAWLRIERYAVMAMDAGYTVGEGLARIFEERYGRRFSVVRNMPVLQETTAGAAGSGPYILYQGAVNEARGFEVIVPAWKNIDVPLVVCGDGNFMEQLKDLIQQHGVAAKIELRGMLPPEQLPAITAGALFGINFTEAEGLNQYYCLPNKFFDYVQAGIPQLTNDYPEYRRLNEQFEVALLLPELSVEGVSEGVHRLLSDRPCYERLRANANRARAQWHWDAEAPRLLDIYRKAFARG
ncbi:glycosyltransferase family protein [Flaviaesturariibacter terrae]